ncbi:hypothetical protein H4R20_004345, partial [Coemansia guatemalensis]
MDDIYPLPVLREIFEELASAKFFTMLDITKVYHCLPIAELDQLKMAFMWVHK